MTAVTYKSFPKIEAPGYLSATTDFSKLLRMDNTTRTVNAPDSFCSRQR